MGRLIRPIFPLNKGINMIRAIVMIGNIADGFRFIGPFDCIQWSVEWAAEWVDEPWAIVPLTSEKEYQDGIEKDQLQSRE